MPHTAASHGVEGAGHPATLIFSWLADMPKPLVTRHIRTICTRLAPVPTDVATATPIPHDKD
jgi:hypothetical protein